jgi:glutathione synthase
MVASKKKAISVAFQMEPLEIDREYITNTLLLMQEAKDRGFKVFHYQAKELSLKNGKVVAPLREVTKLDIKKDKDYYTLAAPKWTDLGSVDVVWIRQNPPFNMEYITATYMLEMIHPKTFVVNDPASVRNNTEKLMPYLWPQYLPPTLITKNIPEMEAFIKQHKDVVIKPLYGYSGFGVYRFKQGDPNLEAYLEEYEIHPTDALIVQPYIKAVEKGNIRVVFFDGEIAGSIRTIPAKGEFRLYRHSSDNKTTLTKREKDISLAVGKELKKRGVIFAGLDIIGDYLTEVNVTSVGSLQRLNELYKRKTQAELWDVVLKKKRT